MITFAVMVKSTGIGPMGLEFHVHNDLVYIT